MTKWFDTNYHYLVPRDRASASVPSRAEHVCRTVQRGGAARLCCQADDTRAALAALAEQEYLCIRFIESARPPPLPRTRSCFSGFLEPAHWVQIDEPDLVLDLNRETIQREPPRCYERLTASTPGIRILFATGFGSLQETLDVALRLPVGGPRLDLVPWKRSVRERLFELRRRR